MEGIDIEKCPDELQDMLEKSIISLLDDEYAIVDFSKDVEIDQFGRIVRKNWSLELYLENEPVLIKIEKV
ncbi:hypothetical protein ACFQL7_20740 [Halocatena marina]|uniref:Uncharacterized protein n=1 Tax=Halocatena marina TaxID=2934937 RepID=A0ABD5YUV0_9EURY|nr:hypothetical protein [Halocatena marina]